MPATSSRIGPAGTSDMNLQFADTEPSHCASFQHRKRVSCNKKSAEALIQVSEGRSTRVVLCCVRESAYSTMLPFPFDAHQSAAATVFLPEALAALCSLAARTWTLRRGFQTRAERKGRTLELSQPKVNSQ